MDCYEQANLHFWARDKVGAQAEVDYVISFNSHIIPIEVKSGAIGRLRSLLKFLEEKKSPLGIKISSQKLMFNHQVLSVPFYLVSELFRLVEEVLEAPATVQSDSNQ